MTPLCRFASSPLKGGPRQRPGNAGSVARPVSTGALESN